MESMRSFASVAYYLLGLGIATWGLLLATGKARLQSGLSLEYASSHRARTTGVLLVIGQVIGVLLMASGLNPFSQATTVFGCSVIPFLLAIAIARLRPEPEQANGREKGS